MTGAGLGRPTAALSPLPAGPSRSPWGPHRFLVGADRLTRFRDFPRLLCHGQGRGPRLVPALADWSQAGRLLARVAQVHGYEAIGRAHLTNDALIAASVARRGFTSITANGRDFARLAALHPFAWELLPPL